MWLLKNKSNCKLTRRFYSVIVSDLEKNKIVIRQENRKRINRKYYLKSRLFESEEDLATRKKKTDF